MDVILMPADWPRLSEFLLEMRAIVFTAVRIALKRFLHSHNKAQITADGLPRRFAPRL
jgi:hypothetical protein